MIKNKKIIGGLLILVGSWLISLAESNPEMQAGKKQNGLYYVVVKQAEIKGQVFVLVGEENGTSRPAVDLPIIVKDPEQAGELIAVKTDSKGIFILPNLERGEYLLLVSKLKLRLKIIEETDDNTLKAIASKIIIVFLPPEMIIQE